MSRLSSCPPLLRLLFVLTLCPAFASGQQQTARAHGPGAATFDISGFVRSEVDDQPVQGARLELKTESDNLAHPALLSGGRGEFRFGGFPGGDYFIIADKAGYEPARIRVTIALHGDQVIIRLRPIAGTAPPLVAGNSNFVRNAAVPEKALEAFEKGVTLLNIKSDYRGGIAQFERATQLFPGYYEAYVQMGVAYDRLGDAASAERALRKSIEVSSGKYAEPMFLLAEMFNDRGRFADAEQAARLGISAQPSSPRGHYELARALGGLKRDTEAEASAMQARELKPDSPPVYLLLANLHKRLHNYPALLQDLDTYLELAPIGPASDQARALRDQVQKALDAQPKQSAATQPKP